MKPIPAPVVEAHAFCAAWNVGDRGLIPLEGPKRRPMPPFEPNVGSGKFVTPCERMHCEKRSSAARRLADSGGGWPPFGRYERQLCIADWNAGALTATPFTVIDVPEPAICFC